MTGYGRGAWSRGTESLEVELRSVNNRFLGLKTRLPEALSRFEPLIEGEVRRRIHRGSVTCHVTRRREGGIPQLDTPRLLKSRQALESFARDHGIPGEVDLKLLVSLPSSEDEGLIAASDEPQIEEGLRSALGGALETLDQMRRREGAALMTALSDLATGLEALLGKARLLAGAQAGIQFEKMRERVGRLLEGREVPSENLSRELALIAERSDVSEELTRLSSHLGQIRHTLAAGGPVGKRLDFLLQEVGREINTVGSKSTDAALTHTVVEMKVLAEQLREQVQNLE